MQLNKEPIFFHLQDKISESHFIVIRGSASLKDFIEDLQLFSEIGVIQTISHLFPLLYIWPAKMIQELIHLCSFFEHHWLAPGHEKHYFKSVESYINEKIKNEHAEYVTNELYNLNNMLQRSQASNLKEDEEKVINFKNNVLNKMGNVYVIGHSLGGGIAQIIAARHYESKLSWFIDFYNNHQRQIDFSRYSIKDKKESKPMRSNSVHSDIQNDVQNYNPAISRAVSEILFSDNLDESSKLQIEFGRENNYDSNQYYKQYLRNNFQIRSINFNAPGTYYSSTKFGFDAQSLDYTSNTVLADRDFVGKIDKHGGQLQIIDCKEKTWLHCHSSIHTFCKLYFGCNAPQKYESIKSQHFNEWNQRDFYNFKQKTEYLQCLCGVTSKSICVKNGIFDSDMDSIQNPMNSMDWKDVEDLTFIFAKN